MAVKKAVLIILGTILFLVGAFYAVTLHGYQVGFGTDFGLPHEIHQIIGIFLMLAAFIVFWLSRQLK